MEGDINDDNKIDEIHGAVTELRKGQQGFKDSISELTFGQKEMAKNIGAMATEVRTTNGRVGALETTEAVRIGVEKSNARMFATVIGVGAVLIAGAIGLLGVFVA